MLRFLSLVLAVLLVPSIAFSATCNNDREVGINDGDNGYINYCGKGAEGLTHLTIGSVTYTNVSRSASLVLVDDGTETDLGTFWIKEYDAGILFKMVLDNEYSMAFSITALEDADGNTILYDDYDGDEVGAVVYFDYDYAKLNAQNEPVYTIKFGVKQTTLSLDSEGDSRYGYNADFLILVDDHQFEGVMLGEDGLDGSVSSLLSGTGGRVGESGDMFDINWCIGNGELGIRQKSNDAVLVSGCGIE